MVTLGTQGWELHHGPTCRGCAPEAGLRDRFWARCWLQQFIADPVAVRTIRNLLFSEDITGTLGGMTDQEAIDQMANMLSTGAWHVHAPVFSSSRDRSGGSHAIQKPGPLTWRSASTRRKLIEPPQPADEGSSLPPTADEERIAMVLKTAAAHGIPFCEECAKGASRRVRQGVNA